MEIRRTLFRSLAAAALLLPSLAGASENQASMSHTMKGEKASTGYHYTLSTCPVSGQELEAMGDPVVYNYKGREIRFCCPGCIREFEKEPQKYIEKIDTAMIKNQKPYYPLQECVVSGSKLDAMKKPADVIYKNRLVRFCCPMCEKTFSQDAETYMTKLDQAMIQQNRI